MLRYFRGVVGGYVHMFSERSVGVAFLLLTVYKCHYIFYYGVLIINGDSSFDLRVLGACCKCADIC